MFRPQISVIMLTYNRQKLVPRAIASILNQTLIDFEFIIVDNGSTDESGEIAKKFAEIDARIRFFRLEKSTISKARNFGLDQARGEFIAFVDDDDFADPEMLEFLFHLAKESEAEMAVCGSWKEVEGKRLPNQIYDEKLVMRPEEAVIEMLKRKKYNVAMPGKLIHKRLFEKVRFSEGVVYDDIWIGFKLFTLAKKTVAMGVPKYCFHRHEKNHSNFTTVDNLLSENQLREYAAAFRYRTEYLSERLPKISGWAIYSEYSWLISMVNKIESNQLSHCYNVLQEFRAVIEENLFWFWHCEYLQDFEKKFILKYFASSPTYTENCIVGAS